MANSLQTVLDCEVLNSRKSPGKDGRKGFWFHRVLVNDGFGIKQTVDVGSMIGEKKLGAVKMKVSISVDRDKNGALTGGIRVMEMEGT
jgi:hypothetical protein